MKKTSITAALLLVASASASALVVDNTGDANSSIGSFGESNTATYGQTFTVGADNVLDSFTFFLDDNLNSDFVDFEAYVFAWGGDRATGSALFSTGPFSTTNNGGAGGFEEFTIATGGITLDAGSQYVAFFSASNLFDGINGTSRWQSVSGADSVAGGEFVFINNGSDFSQITTRAWTDDFQCRDCDLAYRMEFSSAQVPAPAPLALLGLGLVALAYSRRK